MNSMIFTDRHAQLPLVDAAPITTTPLSHFCPTCGENFTAGWRLDDHKIIAHTLTESPLLVDEWGETEWAALAADGTVICGTTRKLCLARLVAHNEVWARGQQAGAVAP